MRLSLGEDWSAAAVLAAAVTMILPLWVADVPAMPDYPAHLASFYLIAGGAHDPTLARFYFIHWAWIPNLAFEYVVPMLAPWLDISVTTKILLSVAVASWVIAPALIHRALYGRLGVAPLAAAFFAFNDNFMWGFFNYYLGAGLALLAFAGWLASRSWRSTVRVAVFAPALLAIYFCHLFAVAVFLLVVLCYELSGLIERRALTLRAAFSRAWPLALIALPTVLMFFFLKPPGNDTHVTFNLMDTFRDRFEAAIAVSFDRPGYVALGALILFLAIGAWRRWISFHAGMKIVLFTLLVLTLFAPEEAMGGWGVDLRLPALLGTLTFASLEIRLPKTARVSLATAALVAVAFNAAALAGNWRYYDAQFHEFRAAIAGLPRGVRLMTVLDGDAIGKAADQPYWHVAEFAVIDRAGFTPLLFTTRGQHVVQLRPGLEKIAATSAQQGSPPDVTELDDLAAGTVDKDWDIEHVFPYLMDFQCKYDEVALVHLNGHRSPVPDTLRLRHTGSYFSLYDIDHEGCPKI
jgi:hypothetical protein